MQHRYVHGIDCEQKTIASRQITHREIRVLKFCSPRIERRYCWCEVYHLIKEAVILLREWRQKNLNRRNIFLNSKFLFHFPFAFLLLLLFYRLFGFRIRRTYINFTTIKTAELIEHNIDNVWRMCILIRIFPLKLALEETSLILRGLSDLTYSHW